ncbi:MAG: right-handed parallel beta-helix repeat-containing protein, partial [Deltaproteobacteria bacterium]|nr:right-handed parallel beta-helix repeat-containing protein [Deltaproteobacteria bacterium]
SVTCPHCGNGIREGEEQCDKEDFGSESCISRGFTRGQLSCTQKCFIDASGCYNVDWILFQDEYRDDDGDECKPLTLQHLVDRAKDGDVIQVVPGTWVGNTTISGKSLTIVSWAPHLPEAPVATILEGDGNGPTITIVGKGDGSETKVVIKGLTIRNGRPGVQVGDGVDLTMDNCIVELNSSSGSGGGVSVTGGRNVTLSNTVVRENEAGLNGGGLFVLAGPGHVRIVDSTFEGNQAGGNGGGLAVEDCLGDVIYMERNRLKDNVAGGTGGGVFLGDGCSEGSGSDLTSLNAFTGNKPDDVASGSLLACCAGEACSLARESDCAESGGKPVEAGSCDPNPCKAEPADACCVGDACSMSSIAACKSAGGDPMPGLTCTPDPCCMPECAGKACGDGDGCGGKCTDACIEGACTPPSVTGIKLGDETLATMTVDAGTGSCDCALVGGTGPKDVPRLAFALAPYQTASAFFMDFAGFVPTASTHGHIKSDMTGDRVTEIPFGSQVAITAKDPNGNKLVIGFTPTEVQILDASVKCEKGPCETCPGECVNGVCITCGNGKIDAGEQCDPAKYGACYGPSIQKCNDDVAAEGCPPTGYYNEFWPGATCAALPGACCHFDEQDTCTEVAAKAACKGQFLKGAHCEGLTCTWGACCDPVTKACEDGVAACLGAGKHWVEHMNCADMICGKGVCCLADGSCRSDLKYFDYCDDPGNVFKGDQTCAQAKCSAGACCSPQGLCEDSVLPADCKGYSKHFMGKTCADVKCVDIYKLEGNWQLEWAGACDSSAVAVGLYWSFYPDGTLVDTSSVRFTKISFGEETLVDVHDYVGTWQAGEVVNGKQKVTVNRCVAPGYCEGGCACDPHYTKAEFWYDVANHKLDGTLEWTEEDWLWQDGGFKCVTSTDSASFCTYSWSPLETVNCLGTCTNVLESSLYTLPPEKVQAIFESIRQCKAK